MSLGTLPRALLQHSLCPQLGPRDIVHLAQTSRALAKQLSGAPLVLHFDHASQPSARVVAQLAASSFRVREIYVDIADAAHPQLEQLVRSDVSAPHLRVFSGAALRDVSALGACVQLERVSLASSWGLTSVDGLCDVAGNAKSLRDLDLSLCVALISLSGLHGCAALERINLRQCRQLRDIGVLAECKRLRYVNLRGCSSLENVEPLEQLKSLEDLDLSEMDALLDGSPITRCVSLQRLALEASRQINFLPGRHVGDSLSGSAASVSPIASNPLRSASFPDSLSLLSASMSPVFGGGSGLRYLQHRGRRLAALRELDMSRHKTLSCDDLGALAHCPNLQSLNLTACTSIDDISSLLQSCPLLVSLVVRRCKHLRALPVEGFAELRTLDASYCDSIEDFTPVRRSAHRIRYLDLSGTRLALLEQILPPIASPVGHLQHAAEPAVAAIETLILSACDKLTTLGGVRRCRSLRYLDISRCPGIRDLAPLWRLAPHLYTLKIDHAHGISELTPLSKVVELRECSLTSLPALVDLGPLRRHAQLRRLDLSGCAALRDLSPIAGCVRLEELTAAHCVGLCSLSPLAELRALRSLDLTGCAMVKDCTPLANLPAIEYVSLNSTAVRDTRPLVRCPNLKELDLVGAKNLVHIGHFPRGRRVAIHLTASPSAVSVPTGAAPAAPAPSALDAYLGSASGAGASRAHGEDEEGEEEADEDDDSGIFVLDDDDFVTSVQDDEDEDEGPVSF